MTAKFEYVETACGWKGIMRKSDSVQTALTSLMDSQSRHEQEIGDEWLGGEPNLLDVRVEKQGVYDILAALTPQEKVQMKAFDKTMAIRHFRAEKGDTEKAIKQIQTTLAWRIDFGVDVIVSCFTVEGTNKDTKAHKEMREIFSQEAIPGKLYTRGYDREGRALQYMTPARENTHNEVNNMRFLVFNLEKSIACTKRMSMLCNGSIKQPLEKLNLVIDFDDFKIRNAPPMSTTQYTLDILQRHYPERMHHAYLLHPPMVFRAFWSLIKVFVDPTTKEKIVFCAGQGGKEKLTDNVKDKGKLEIRSYGRDPTIRDYDSEEYLHLPYNVSFDE